jgi:hypothetical protein
MAHLSDSSEQNRAESELVRQLAADLGVSLQPMPIELQEGVRVNIDGYNQEHRILCEVYAHIGHTRGGQPHKIAKDILKLIAVEKRHPGPWQKILCFADQAAAQCVSGSSWLATVCSDFGIVVRVFSLPPDLHEAVAAAQRRQVMVNPA